MYLRTASFYSYDNNNSWRVSLVEVTNSLIFIIDGGTDCVGVVSGIKRCFCADTRDVTQTGFLVDGMVPTINVSQSGGTWASQLYIISGAMTT